MPTKEEMLPTVVHAAKKLLAVLDQSRGCDHLSFELAFVVIAKVIERRWVEREAMHRLNGASEGSIRSGQDVRDWTLSQAINEIIGSS